MWDKQTSILTDIFDLIGLLKILIAERSKESKALWFFQYIKSHTKCFMVCLEFKLKKIGRKNPHFTIQIIWFFFSIMFLCILKSISNSKLSNQSFPHKFSQSIMIEKIVVEKWAAKMIGAIIVVSFRCNRIMLKNKKEGRNFLSNHSSFRVI